jgi:predicted transcriptional regulator
MEAHENRSLTNSTVSDILNKLVKASLIEKNDEYSISDPLLKHGLLENPLPER